MMNANDVASSHSKRQFHMRCYSAHLQHVDTPIWCVRDIYLLECGANLV